MQGLQFSRLCHISQFLVRVVQSLNLFHGEIEGDFAVTLNVVMRHLGLQKLEQLVLDDLLVLELRQVTSRITGRESDLPLDRFGDEGV